MWIFYGKMFVHAGNNITAMLLTQALQPLGCDGGAPAGKHFEFDLDFNPLVCLIVSPSTSYNNNNNNNNGYNNSGNVDCVNISEIK